MARTKFKKKGAGLPLFPEVQYVSERKGAKLSKKQKIISEAVDAKGESEINLEINESNIRLMKKNQTDKLSLKAKQTLLTILVLMVMFFAFLPVLKP